MLDVADIERAGGEEAALFAGDLFRMYSRYCEARGWRIRVMSENQTSLDGYKEIVFTVKGEPNKLKKGVIYLTFDDGPSTKVTKKILK